MIKLIISAILSAAVGGGLYLASHNNKPVKVMDQPTPCTRPPCPSGK